MLGPRSCNEVTSLAVFCPITSAVKGYPFEVLLPPTCPVSGVVLADQVRNLDWCARSARFEIQAPLQVVCDVKDKLAILIGHVLTDK